MTQFSTAGAYHAVIDRKRQRESFEPSTPRPRFTSPYAGENARRTPWLCTCGVVPLCRGKLASSSTNYSKVSSIPYFFRSRKWIELLQICPLPVSDPRLCCADAGSAACATIHRQGHAGSAEPRSERREGAARFGKDLEAFAVILGLSASREPALGNDIHGWSCTHWNNHLY